MAHSFVFKDEQVLEKKHLAEIIVGEAGGWLDANGFELVDFSAGREPRGYFVRFFIDKPGGVSIDDCVFASEHLGTILDGIEALDSEYFLEVSSPGLERPLKRLEDFERFKGSLVKVKLKKLRNGSKTIRGRIKGTLHGMAVIETASAVYEVAWDDIFRANLEVEF